MWQTRFSRRTRRRCLAAALLCAATLGAACDETGDVQVTSIKFIGNETVSGDELSRVIATRKSGFLPWSTKRFFDRPEFERDVKRIEAYYSDRGFPRAKVVSVDVKLNDKKDKVDLTVEVSEGAPVVIEAVAFEGLDEIPPDHFNRLKDQLPIRVGAPRDQRLIASSHDLIVAELRDHGFAYGAVRVVERAGSNEDRVQLVLQSDTGPPTVFGPIKIEGVQSVGENIVARELVLKEGEPYRIGQIRESQRRLTNLELFQFTNISTNLPENRATAIPVDVVVTESKHRRLTFGAGYGSEEKARARITWKHLNFLGDARTLETEGKASSLEQGIRGAFVEPHFLTSGLSLRFSGSSWWSQEPIYEYRTIGGRITLTRDFSKAPVGADRGVRNLISISLIHEYDDYAITQAALDDPTMRDILISLGLDPETGKGKGTVSGFGLDFERNTAGRPLDPREGYSIIGHIENADQLAGGTFNYTEYLGDGRKYLSFGPRFVWANRIRAATLSGTLNEEIPFYKRYFLGGSSSVRGWGRYEISPLTESGQPIGGRTMLEVSTEARFNIKGNLSGVVFVDGGNVWESSWDLQFDDLRWAVGPGIRYDTPIGPIRFDLGIQLNPIEGLIIDGNLEERQWRVHFSIGQAF
jgi:outer membrane protein assembly complex protein YaeT